MSARFGSEDWLADRLLEVLTRAREAVDAEYARNATLTHCDVDLDHYVFLRVPRRQRKVWALLRRLEQSHDWISPWTDCDVLDIKPLRKPGGVYSKNADKSAADAVERILREAGIDADVEEHWR